MHCMPIQDVRSCPSDVQYILYIVIIDIIFHIVIIICDFHISIYRHIVI